MNKPDGGQAFPVPGFSDVYGDGSTAHQQPTDGMTLRDWFAGQAIQSLGALWGRGHEEWAAEDAYLIADAMIAERNKS